TAIAQLGDVHAECGEQILGVACREVPVPQGGTQPLRHRLAFDAAEKTSLKPIEMGEFLARCERGMVGDIVSGADEFVECQNGGAVLGFDQYRCDREVLVPMTFAGS